MLSACVQAIFQILLTGFPFAYTAHIATMQYARQLYSISIRHYWMWWGRRTLLKFSWRRFRISTQTLAEGSVWVHVTLHSATRIIVRTALKKLFALQQLLLPRDCWIFYRSSKPYFTVCSSRAAAGTHLGLWYRASNRSERQTQEDLLQDSTHCKSNTFCSWHSPFLKLSQWLTVGHLDLDLTLMFFDLYWWESHYKMCVCGGGDTSPPPHTFFWSAQGRLHVPWMVIKRIWWLESSSFAACFIWSGLSFKTRLLEVLLAQIRVYLLQTEKYMHQRKNVTLNFHRYIICLWQRQNYRLSRWFIKPWCFPCLPKRFVRSWSLLYNMVKADAWCLKFQTNTRAKWLWSVLKATFDESVYLNHYHQWAAIIIIFSLYTRALIQPNCRLSKQSISWICMSATELIVFTGVTISAMDLNT